MADSLSVSRISLFQAKSSVSMSHSLCPLKCFLRPLSVGVVSSLVSSSGPHGKRRKLKFSSQTLHSLVWRSSRGRGWGEGRAGSFIVNASSGAANVGEGEGNLPLPPSSKEETVQQAGASLFAVLEKALKQQGPTTVKEKKKFLQRQVRLRVDIPILEDSPQALFTLTLDLVDSFLGRTKFAGRVAVYFSDPAVLDAAVSPLSLSNSSASNYMKLGSSDSLSRDAVVALVIAPTFLQAADVDSVIKSAGLRPVVVVNPEWSEEEEQDKKWGAFLNSFKVVYSFIPLNIQGFFSKTEGAVFKCVRGGAPEGQPWLIYVKEGDNFKCVSRLKKRPTPTDLENALYSSMAANSPVNKSIAFLRGLARK